MSLDLPLFKKLSPNIFPRKKGNLTNSTRMILYHTIYNHFIFRKIYTFRFPTTFISNHFYFQPLFKKAIARLI